MIYFDYNATTPLHPDIAKMFKASLKTYANPSSVHQLGQQARYAVEIARQQAATYLEASVDQVTWVGCASEANNWVLKMTAWPLLLARQPVHLIVSAIEHPSVMDTALYLESVGARVSVAPVDAFGRVDLDALRGLITGDTRLISIMSANNEIGTIQPIQDIAAIAKAQGCLFHTDAVQAVGKMPLSFKDIGCDFLTASGHKCYGPKGVGVLVTKESPLVPFIHGGAQERQLRAGTECVWGIMGMGKAMDLLSCEGDRDRQGIEGLTQTFKSELARHIPDVVFNGHPTSALSNTCNVSFLGTDAQVVMMNLDLAGVAVSTGSACATGSVDPSPTLMALGVHKDVYTSAIRFSFGKWTTLEEIHQGVDITRKIICNLRSKHL